MDDEFECEDGDEFVEIAARPLDWRPIVGITVNAVGAALQSIGQGVSTIGEIFLGAANWQVELQNAHREMTAELEQLLEEGE